ncbi:MAG TPA: glycosyltransferase [Desulfitobacteriaceae bacterium]|nr:glycosyltransferase [Desulfitobacteriaceae bacterium]
MNTAAKVSVIIPTYNHESYIREAVGSVLGQTYPNIEILVVDDGSTDQTKKVLAPYLSKINYIYKANGGTASALNTGIAGATGRYISWLSADDVFRPQKIARQVAKMESGPDLGFIYSSFAVIDALGRIQYEIHSPYYSNKKDMVLKLAEGCFINGSTVMMRKAALEKAGGFDESLAQAHDYDLWLRLIHAFPVGFQDEVLLNYRWHGKNMSQQPDKACEQEVNRRAKKLFPEWLGTGN